MNTASLFEQVLAVLRREGRRWSCGRGDGALPGRTDNLTCLVIDSLIQTGQIDLRLDVNRTY